MCRLANRDAGDFHETFYYPIEALIGNADLPELLVGIGMQILWILIGALLVNIVWKLGIKKFTSVGN